MARELKRVNLNLPEDVVKRIDAYADKVCITRTTAVVMLCNTALDSQKAMNDLSELLIMAKAARGNRHERILC